MEYIKVFQLFIKNVSDTNKNENNKNQKQTVKVKDLIPSFMLKILGIDPHTKKII